MGGYVPEEAKSMKKSEKKTEKKSVLERLGRWGKAGAFAALMELGAVEAMAAEKQASKVEQKAEKETQKLAKATVERVKQEARLVQKDGTGGEVKEMKLKDGTRLKVEYQAGKEGAKYLILDDGSKMMLDLNADGTVDRLMFYSEKAKDLELMMQMPSDMLEQQATMEVGRDVAILELGAKEVKAISFKSGETSKKDAGAYKAKVQGLYQESLEKIQASK